MGKVLKQLIVYKKGKFRAAQKKTAVEKDKLWKDTPYFRENLLLGPRGQRKDQVNWHHHHLLQPLIVSDKKIINMLVTDRQEIAEFDGAPVSKDSWPIPSRTLILLNCNIPTRKNQGPWTGFWAAVALGFGLALRFLYLALGP